MKERKVVDYTLLPLEYTCTLCGQTKPVTEFSVKQDRAAPRLHSRCKPCVAASHLEYSRATVIERMKYNRGWRRANREHYNAYQRRKSNTPEYRATVREWYAKNAERLRPVKCEAGRRNRAANLVRYRRQELFRTLRREERIRKNGNCNLTLIEWETLRLLTNYKCLRCERNGKCDMDHIIPVSKGGQHTISNIQPLCHRCNMLKFTKSTDYRSLLLITLFKSTLD